MKTEIFVVTHKKFVPPNNKLYIPIQVGKKITNQELGYISDDEGMNIADKNPNYCELTALYWMWKNVSDTDIIGLCHYRRFFSRKPLHKDEKFYLTEDDIKEILKDYEVIVPKKTYRPDMNVREWYSYCEGRDKDIRALHETMTRLYPEYVSTYEAVLKSKSLFYCNMFIIDKKRFDEYCKWLFDLLFDLETRIDISDYSKQEARVYGYLSELLLNVWIIHNNLKYKQIGVVNTEVSNLQNFKRMIESFIRRVVKKIMIKMGLRKSDIED